MILSSKKLICFFLSITNTIRVVRTQCNNKENKN